MISNKLLSVIIPTYNMEKLLPRCLDSLVSTSMPELLEAIVVNDGSKDNSLQIAQEYQIKYPEIITVIDKPNGNYGSTINAALPVAKGKFFKILDSDDRYDTSVLNDFLTQLTHIDSDIVVTHFSQLGPGSRREVIKYNTMGREIYDYNREYLLDNILGDGYIRFFLMHSLAYKTQLLRDMNYRQTEGISYTDTEFASYPIFHAQTITFLNLNLYQYYMDRDGQTMNPAVLMKSIAQMEKVTDTMIAYYENFDFTKVSNIRQSFLKQYYENRLRIFFKLYLLDMPRADFNKDDFDRIYQKYSPFIQNHHMTIRLYPENKILHTDYIKFWEKHHRRWNPAFEWFNRQVDKIVKWGYVVLFRK